VSVIASRSVGELAAPSQQSLIALSWLNFVLSGMQTAFRAIAAAYLAIHGWTAKDIGFALTIGTVMGVGATLSPTLTGLIVDQFGRSAGFASLAAEGFVTLVVLAVFLPETKEELSS
jgi:hypothetical protein